MKMPLTPLESRYVRVFLDNLMKWAEAYPLQDQTSETIARVLVDKVICRHGAPWELLSDHGTNFLCAVIQGVCNITGMVKLITTAYHFQTNGLVENFNRTLRAMLAKHSREFGPHAVGYDIYPLAATSNSVCISNQTSRIYRRFSFLLVYEQDARLPMDSVLGMPPPYLVNSEDYQLELAMGLSLAWEVARSEIRNS